MLTEDKTLKAKADMSWLQQWSAELTGASVLELGCSNGTDTAQLVQMAAEITATDIERPAFSDNRITTQALDLRHLFPLPEQSFDVVIASLCLHYFDWATTQAAVAQIHRVLRPGGCVIVRVNSQQDVHYGATGFTLLEPGLFQVRKHRKRFFIEHDINRLFAGDWQLSNVSHRCIDRYEKPKYIWQFKAEKSEPSTGHI